MTDTGQGQLIPEPAPGTGSTGVDVHGIQPWSVLRQDSKKWQQRKAWWRSHGLRDRGGRQDATVFNSGPGSRMHGRVSGGGGSVFDAVLAEACLSWYSPQGGAVLDPMAGGPTRGLVAAALGRRYTGVDLLSAQVDGNREMLDAWPLPLPGTATWISGDARVALPAMTGPFHYLFSCPPYWNLERYSDDPADLSAMPLDGFLDAHAEIIREAARLLADDSFATWVIGDKRGKDGHLCRLPWHTIEAFQSAGLRLINDQVLVTPVGSRMWNLARSWRGTRSATRLHQFVFTFVKGDRRVAAARIKDSGNPPVV